MTDGLHRPNWDDYFMSIALVVAMRSPDPSTKHGSVLVDAQRRILGLGYNGFPRGCRDTELPLTRPEKYENILHSEVNCILNASPVITRQQTTLYVTGHPCQQCFNVIVQYGIRKVLYGRVGSHMVPDEQIKKINHLNTHIGVEMIPYMGDCLQLLRQTIDYGTLKID